MPRATSERFNRPHQASAKPKTSKETREQSGSGSVSNPIFNTDRFGQHILKNPRVAERYAGP